MKKIAYLSCIPFLAACTVNANLTPLDGKPDTYAMFFDRSEVTKSTNGLSPKEKNKVHEQRINAILKSDSNTQDCYVLSEQVFFGEPGSGGVAYVYCPKPPPLENDGLYNRDGSPNKRYFINNEQSA